MKKFPKFTCVILCAASLFLPQVALADQHLEVEVLDTLTLAEPRVNDLKIAELSGLAYDASKNEVIAVSDKGRIFTFSIDLTEGKINELKPLSGHRLVDSNGTRMSDMGFNAEDIALNQDGTLVIVSEQGPRIARFSREGVWIEDIPVPEALRDPAAQRSLKDGLESLALHPQLGLLTAPEEPLANMQRTTQTIYASTGKHFSYDTKAIGTTSIKAMTVLQDSRLLVLERDVSPGGTTLIPWLRLLDISTCKEGVLCDVQTGKVEVPNITDADYEGLTQLEENLFLIVSDDKIDNDHRSVFSLLQVKTPAIERPNNQIVK